LLKAWLKRFREIVNYKGLVVIYSRGSILNAENLFPVLEKE